MLSKNGVYASSFPPQELNSFELVSESSLAVSLPKVQQDKKSQLLTRVSSTASSFFSCFTFACVASEQASSSRNYSRPKELIQFLRKNLETTSLEVFDRKMEVVLYSAPQRTLFLRQFQKLVIEFEQYLSKISIDTTRLGILEGVFQSCASVREVNSLVLNMLQEVPVPEFLPTSHDAILFSNLLKRCSKYVVKQRLSVELQVTLSQSLQTLLDVMQHPLFPNARKTNYHTLEKAAPYLFLMLSPEIRTMLMTREQTKRKELHLSVVEMESMEISTADAQENEKSLAECEFEEGGFNISRLRSALVMVMQDEERGQQNESQ